MSKLYDGYRVLKDLLYDTIVFDQQALYGGFKNFMRGRDPLDIDVVRLPDNQMIFRANADDKAFSTLDVHNPPTVLHVAGRHPQARRLFFEHDHLIASPEGITKSGKLDYCDGGGCMHRAFSNAMLRQKSAKQVEQEYISMAGEMGYLEDDTRTLEELTGDYSLFPGKLLDTFAASHGFMPVKSFKPDKHPSRRRTPVAELARRLGDGLIYGETGWGDGVGTHLVAVKKGKQVVPSFHQMIHDDYIEDVWKNGERFDEPYRAQILGMWRSPEEYRL